MERSQEINELAAALAVAQGAIEGAAKDSANPFFKSKYADLASVWNAVRGPLAANGLSVLQLPSAEGPKVTITTVLAHKSGQWVQSALTMTAKEDTPQAVGSAITYARRYALQSTVGVAPEDDDGEGAQGRSPQGSTAAQKAVAEKKIADLKAQSETKPWTAQFRNMFDQLSGDAYVRIMSKHGYKAAKEVLDSKTARLILDEMEAERDAHKGAVA